MERSCELLLLALLVAAMAASLPLALAYDPSPLQDFCVADAASAGKQSTLPQPAQLLLETCVRSVAHGPLVLPSGPAWLM
ncbi:hypothetical protein C2845_PM12G03790 [Panicum miliaceum]|uniref:Uncharacterized protein n=1 Tax=Panicum miliaceum TaxID=4540 RepID=A0A3L6QGE3_PANMI|nr:hypothetical protein C2845_PM12G03790 [Panicum miliaceum]